MLTLTLLLVATEAFGLFTGCSGSRSSSAVRRWTLTNASLEFRDGLMDTPELSGFNKLPAELASGAPRRNCEL